MAYRPCSTCDVHVQQTGMVAGRRRTSSANAALDLSSVTLPIATAVLFLVGSVVAFCRMFAAGGLSAIAFYVLGTGMAFGFGTAFSTVAPGHAFETLFNELQQSRDLKAINLINSLSVTIVLLCALPLCGRYRGGGANSALNRALDVLQPFRIPLLAISGGMLAVQYSTFPVVEDLLLRSFVDKGRIVVPLSILLSFAVWWRISVAERLVACAICASAVTLGIIQLSKTDVLVPIAAATAGLFLARGSRVPPVVLAVATAFGYFAVLGPIVGAGRTDWRYDPLQNAFADRLMILNEIDLSNAAPSVDGDSNMMDLLTRFAHAPYQSFLINEQREGRPGTSLEDGWAALVPRAVWPEKPDVTRFGLELYGLIVGTSNPESFVAPTYTAEAFWNYGWLGVVLVSVLVGLELGWLSGKWLRLYLGGDLKLGILLFALPVALIAFWVETWIAATYLGGFLMFALLIKAVDLGTPLLLGFKRSNGRLVRKQTINGRSRRGSDGWETTC
jgi:hypothetical protein